MIPVAILIHLFILLASGDGYSHSSREVWGVAISVLCLTKSFSSYPSFLLPVSIHYPFLQLLSIISSSFSFLSSICSLSLIISLLLPLSIIPSSSYLSSHNSSFPSLPCCNLDHYRALMKTPQIYIRQPTCWEGHNHFLTQSLLVKLRVK